MTPTSAFPVLWYIALSAAGVALYSLVRTGNARQNAALTAFVVATLAGDLATLVRPALWTSSFALAREITADVLALATAMSAGRRAFASAPRAWRATCLLAVGGLVPLVLVGWYGLTSAVAQRSGYRGLFVLDGAVATTTAAVVVGRAWYELGESPFESAILTAVLLYYGVRCLYSGSWEVVPGGVAEALGVAQTCAYAGALLFISAAAWRKKELPR